MSRPLFEPGSLPLFARDEYPQSVPTFGGQEYIKMSHPSFDAFEFQQVSPGAKPRSVVPKFGYARMVPGLGVHLSVPGFGEVVVGEGFSGRRSVVPGLGSHMVNAPFGMTVRGPGFFGEVVGGPGFHGAAKRNYLGEVVGGPGFHGAGRRSVVPGFGAAASLQDVANQIQAAVNALKAGNLKGAASSVQNAISDFASSQTGGFLGHFGGLNVGALTSALGAALGAITSGNVSGAEAALMQAIAATGISPQGIVGAIGGSNGGTGGSGAPASGPDAYSQQSPAQLVAIYQQFYPPPPAGMQAIYDSLAAQIPIPSAGTHASAPAAMLKASNSPYFKWQAIQTSLGAQCGGPEVGQFDEMAANPQGLAYAVGMAACNQTQWLDQFQAALAPLGLGVPLDASGNPTPSSNATVSGTNPASIPGVVVSGGGMSSTAMLAGGAALLGLVFLATRKKAA